MKALSIEDEPITTIHADTTSVFVEGQYNSDDPNDALRMKYGHSKDDRPDLKQFNIGLLVTRNGIPFNADVMDGNTADKAWNMEVIDGLKKELTDVKDFVYVADSAMVTKDNLDTASIRGISFISRLPDTFGLSSKLKARAWADNQWVSLGTFSKSKNAATYKAQSFGSSLYRVGL